MRRQVTAGDPGPDRECRRCACKVQTYIDISGGDWIIVCCCCNKPIAGLGENYALANEAAATGREARRKPPIPKDKV